MSDTDLYFEWWIFFHRVALIIERRENYDHLIKLGMKLLDCDHCRDDATLFYNKLPTTMKPFEKINTLHNHVNEVTNKKQFTVEESYKKAQDVLNVNGKTVNWHVLFKNFFELIFILCLTITEDQLPIFREFTSYFIETMPITAKAQPRITLQQYDASKLTLAVHSFYMQIVTQIPQLRFHTRKYDHVFDNPKFPPLKAQPPRTIAPVPTPVPTPVKKSPTPSASPASRNIELAPKPRKKAGCARCAEKRRQKEAFRQKKLLQQRQKLNQNIDIAPFLATRREPVVATTNRTGSRPSIQKPKEIKRKTTLKSPSIQSLAPTQVPKFKSAPVPAPKFKSAPSPNSASISTIQPNGLRYIRKNSQLPVQSNTINTTKVVRKVLNFNTKMGTIVSSNVTDNPRLPRGNRHFRKVRS